MRKEGGCGWVVWGPILIILTSFVSYKGGDDLQPLLVADPEMLDLHTNPCGMDEASDAALCFANLPNEAHDTAGQSQAFPSIDQKVSALLQRIQVQRVKRNALDDPEQIPSAEAAANMQTTAALQTPALTSTSTAPQISTMENSETTVVVEKNEVMAAMDAFRVAVNSMAAVDISLASLARLNGTIETDTYEAVLAVSGAFQDLADAQERSAEASGAAAQSALRRALQIEGRDVVRDTVSLPDPTKDLSEIRRAAEDTIAATEAAQERASSQSKVAQQAVAASQQAVARAWGPGPGQSDSALGDDAQATILRATTALQDLAALQLGAAQRNRQAAQATAALARALAPGSKVKRSNPLRPFGDTKQVNLRLEINTLPDPDAGTEDGATFEFEVGGQWTQPRILAEKVSANESIMRSATLPAWPSELRLAASGSDNWGVARVTLTVGSSMIPLEMNGLWIGADGKSQSSVVFPISK